MEWPWGTPRWWVMFACLTRVLNETILLAWQGLWMLKQEGYNQAAVSGYMKSKAKPSPCCSFLKARKLASPPSRTFMYCLIWWTDAFIVNIWSYVHILVHQFIQAYTHNICLYFLLILPQALKLVDHGYHLPPPPGCPKALYELMIQCWWVSIT